LEETLPEEKETDEKLTTLAKEINLQANGQGAEADADEEQEEEPSATRKSTRRVA